MDFEKPKYQGHCYARTDTFWDPVTEPKIDSGYPGAHAPNGTMPVCSTSADCSGYLGQCNNGTCVCRPGWTGARCSQVKWKVGSARKAYESESWTWGASPIQDEQGQQNTKNYALGHTSAHMIRMTINRSKYTSQACITFSAPK